jgi:hypothetical protein
LCQVRDENDRNVVICYDKNMKLAVDAKSIIVSVAIGGLIGYVGGPAFVLIPWTVVGLVIGYLCNSRKATLVHGAAYGFVLAYVFMISGYSGQAALGTKILPFIVFGIVGAFCGVVLAVIGQYVSKYLHAGGKI